MRTLPLNTWTLRNGALALAAAIALLDNASQARPEGPEAASVSFDAAQVARGADLYEDECASCHGSDLISTDSQATNLTGAAFRAGWRGRAVGERLAEIRATMPPGTTRRLPDQSYLDVISYILSRNGYPARPDSLTTAPSDLKAVIAGAPAK